jgi:hypothetical protein
MLNEKKKKTLMFDSDNGALIRMFGLKILDCFVRKALNDHQRLLGGINIRYLLDCWITQA